MSPPSETYIQRDHRYNRYENRSTMHVTTPDPFPIRQSNDPFGGNPTPA
jgi:hypothetical protein